jgi:hypothetical protein
VRTVGAATVLIACACVVGAHAAGPSTAPPPKLLVGIDDDTAKWRTRPDGLIATYRHLGVGAVRLTIPWQLGQNRPTPAAGIFLHRAALMVARRQRVVLAVYGYP